MDFAHGLLDVESLHVLPILLEQGDEEVNGHGDVDDDLVLSQTEMADGNSEAEHLLELELDSALDGVDLVEHVLARAKQSGKLAGLVETWSKQTRNLSQNSFRCKERIILIGKFFDEFFVFVEFFESLNITPFDFEFLGLVEMDLIGENADLETGLAFAGELDGAAETLVLLRIVVLEADLQLQCLDECALLVG